MARLTPILADERSAAQLLDMAPAKFLDLVGRGYLPDGKEIAPGVLRWDVEDLRKLAKGDLARPDGGLTL
jgi:hypothetical protein